MKLYKNSFIVCGILTIFSLAAIVFMPNVESLDVFYDIALAIFGSAALSTIAAMIGYSSEKQSYKFQCTSFARSFILQVSRFMNTNQERMSDSKVIYQEAGMLHSLYDDYAYANDERFTGFFMKSKKNRKIKKLQCQLFNLSKKLSDIELSAQEAMHEGKGYTLENTITLSDLKAIHNIICDILKCNPDKSVENNDGQAQNAHAEQP